MNNTGRTALWPIYVDKETGKIIDTVTNMSNPIDPAMIEYLKDSTEQIDSEHLKRFVTEMMLTLNCDPIKDYIDCIVIGYDRQNGESINMTNPSASIEPNQNIRMDRLINTVESVCFGQGNENYATDIMTAISNVVARYCATDPSNLESFMGVVDFWRKNLK